MGKSLQVCKLGLTSIIAAIVLSGCATGRTTKFVNEPYVVPHGQPSAKLTNALSPLLEAGELATVVTVLDDCETAKANAELKESVSHHGVMFDMTSAATLVGKTIDVTAGKPMLIQYIFSNGPKRSKTCFVSVVVSLEANKNYSLVGGYTSIKGAIPLTDKPGCALGVLDVQAKRLVPSTTKLCPNN